MRFGLKIAAGVAVGVLAVSSVAAQQAMSPEKPRCSGLLCDMGLFGGEGSEKATLPCNDFVCRVFGGSQQAEAAPPPPAAAPEPAPEKKKAAKVRKTPVKIAKKEPADSKPDATDKK